MQWGNKQTMNQLPAKETTKLNYDTSYNAGYNAGFYANKETLIDTLDDDSRWYRRENSARAILRIIFIAAFVFMFAAFAIAFTVLGVANLIIESGMRWYVSLAPLALAVVIGYIYRGKRQ